MASAELIRRLEWELESITTDVELTKASILESAKRLADRAKSAIEDSQELVDGKDRSLSWIDWMASDVDQVKRIEARLRELTGKQSLLASLLRSAKDE